MNDDVRKQVAGVARSLRRKLERERAQGSGDLLATGVVKASRLIEAGVERAPARPGAPPGLAPLAGGSVVPAAPPPRTAPAPPAPRAASVESWELPEQGDTFKLTPPPPAPASHRRGAPKPEAAAVETELFELPAFTDDLYPSALGGARDELVTISEPLLQQVAAEARACTKCGLCTTRTNAVPGVGSARSGIVFVGEAPGADEDMRGEPFVGRAGELLTKMIAAMDEKQIIPGVSLSRETVYIANVLKCRPPENRNPLPHEIESCSPYLMRQLEALKPRVICCLGKFAAELLLQLKGSVGAMRGKTYRWRGAKMIVTYHPAYCLRNPDAKKPVWEDLRRLAQEYLTD